MNITPIAGAIGAEISDLDLGLPMTDTEKLSLRELVNRYEVIFFRDQAITPAQQRDLAALFGPLQPHPAYNYGIRFSRSHGAPKHSRKAVKD